MKINIFLIRILVLSICFSPHLFAGTVSFSNFRSTLEVQTADGDRVQGGFVAVGTSPTLEEFGFSLGYHALIAAISSDFKQFGDATVFGGQEAFYLNGFFSGVASGDGGNEDFVGKNILLVGGTGSKIIDSAYLFVIDTGATFEADAPLFAANVDVNSGTPVLGAEGGTPLTEGVAGAFQMVSVISPLKFEFTPDGAILVGCDKSFIGEIDIPSNFQSNKVTSIEANAFRDCVNLTHIKIPATINNIGVNAFSNCNALLEINVSNSNEKYSSLDGILFNKEKTELIKCPVRFTGDYKVPDTVRIISSRAFHSCDGLNGLTLPSGLTGIGESAFRGCKGIENIIIPDTVEAIGEYAFLNCIGLRNLSVSINNPLFSTVDGVLFNKEKTVLISCGGGKTGDYVIPESVNHIGDGAFGFCKFLTGLKFPSQLETIGYFALGSCTGLRDITFPASVNRIGDFAFRECKNINKILFLGNAPVLGQQPFSFVSADVVINYPITASGYGDSFAGIRAEGLYPPVFEDQSITINENLKLDSIAGLINASDQDSQNLNYTILRNEDFDLDSQYVFRNDGKKVIVNDSDDLDFESNRSINLIVEVDDQVFKRVALVTFLLNDDRQEDFDKDGLTEAEEEDIYGTSDLLSDSDGDGYSDSEEILANVNPLDSNVFPNEPPEVSDQSFSFMENSKNDYVIGEIVATDPNDDILIFSASLNIDYDGDGANAVRFFENKIIINDSDEFDFEKNPKITIDLIVSDGLIDSSAVITFDLTDNRDEDFDQDGLTELEEEDIYGTSDILSDFDGDGFSDGEEVFAKLDPLNAFEYPYSSLPVKDDFNDNNIDTNMWSVGVNDEAFEQSVVETNQSVSIQGGGQLATRNEYDPSSNGVAISGSWTFSSLGSDADSSNVIKGNVSIFNGPDDLLLDAGTNVIAVNINGTDEALNVNGVTFLSSGGINFSSGGAPPERVENSGVAVNTSSSHAMSPWTGTVPEFKGQNIVSAENLGKIMQGLRYSRSSKGYDIESVIEGLDSNKLYHVQLLFHEVKAFHWQGKETYRRRFDIAVQGELVVDHFGTLGDEPWSESKGVVYSGQFSPDQEGKINILLGRQPLPGDANNTEFIRSWPPDSNPILQAVIIHELAPVEENNDDDDVSIEDRGDYFQVFTQSDAVRDELTGDIKNGVEFNIHSGTGELRILSRGGVRVEQIGASTLGRIDVGQQFDFQITDDGENLSFLVFEKGSPQRRAYVKAKVLGDSINKNRILFKNRHANDGVAKIDDIKIDDFMDSDGDGLADWWESKYGLNAEVDDSTGDEDNDGLTNIDEFNFFSDPFNSDTDGDLLSDGYERGYGRYVVIPGRFSWEEAALNASTLGGVLATFETIGHWRIALDSLGERGLDGYVGVWIGAQKIGNSGDWGWYNGNKFNFSEWAPNQPLSVGGSGKAAISGGFGSAPYQWEEVPTRGVRDGYLMFIGNMTDPSISDTDGDGWNDGTEIEFGSVAVDANSEPSNRSQGELIYDENLRPESFGFRFAAAYGFRYSVKGSKDLKNWDTLEQGIIGEGGTVTRFYPVEDKIKFFKVSRE